MSKANDDSARTTSQANVPSGRPGAPAAPPRALRIAVVVAIIIVVACVIVTALATRRDSSRLDDLMASVRTNRVQSVELDTDRVYFGNLRAAGNGWLELRSAYYIREQPTADAAKDAQPTQQVAAVQSELTQPDGTLLINADHVVRIQNLRANSRVTQAIEDVKAG